MIGKKIDEVRIDGKLSSLRRDLNHFREIGLEAVELPVHGLDAIRNGRLDSRRMNETLEVLDDFHFSYSVHAPNPLNLMDVGNLDLHMSVFRASLEFCERVGAKIIVYHSGRFIPEETFHIKGKCEVTSSEKKRLLDQEKEALAQLSEAFPGVIICLENARPYIHHSPYSYAEQIDQLKAQVTHINRSNVRINLDVGHMHMASCFYGYDIPDAVQSIKSYVAHMHLHDNFGGAVHHYEKQQTHQIPFGRGDSHMPVGWGQIPIHDILSIILPEYSGMLMMELRSRYFDYIEESRNNLSTIVGSLTSKIEDGADHPVYQKLIA
jgi:sugar phosphate isomerase/epimerase